MNFHLLFVSSVSACFELENNDPYYAAEPYDVKLNGAVVLRGVKTNVFSLFGLKPDQSYTVSIGESVVEFCTGSESVCISVRDFGAAGDGITDDTTAIQSAINVCAAGGRVLVPAGTYFVRPLVLKSDITIDLQEGAVLLADTVEEHFPVLPGELSSCVTGEAYQVSTWEGCPAACRQSFISAYHARNINIVGRGIIDGNGQNSTWWIKPKEKKYGRPKLVFLNACENVVFHGIKGCNSPSWNFHPFFCRNVGFYDIAVAAPKDSPNTDGTDPESCDGISYIGVRFSVGDDAIAIKSGKIYMGMKYRKPTENITIHNCLMEYAHGAVVLGSEMSGGIRGLKVSQCLFDHTDRGIRIKTRRGRGNCCIVDGVEFSNVHMINVMCPLVINMYYCCDPDGHEEFVWSKEKHPVDDTTPYLGSFTFRDMVCTDCEWAAGFFYGLPEQPVGSVCIEDTVFTFRSDASSGQPAMMDNVPDECRRGLYFNNVQAVVLRNVSISGQDGDEVITENVSEVQRT